MNKQEFIAKLRSNLSGLPNREVEERLNFYSEMIDDRIEEGFSEEAAVMEIGSVDEIVSQIVSDISFGKKINEKINLKRRLNAWEIALLVIGLPIWLSLLIATFAVIFAVYVVLWSVIISLWAMFGSLIAGAVGGIVAGFGIVFVGNILTGILMMGVGVICAGLSIFTFFACKAATKGTLLLTKKIALSIKNCFGKKEKE